MSKSDLPINPLGINPVMDNTTQSEAINGNQRVVKKKSEFLPPKKGEASNQSSKSMSLNRTTSNRLVAHPMSQDAQALQSFLGEVLNSDTQGKAPPQEASNVEKLLLPNGEIDSKKLSQWVVVDHNMGTDDNTSPTEATKGFDNAIADFEKLKEAFGGKGEGYPILENDLNKKFLGLPIVVLKFAVNKGVQKGWIPKKLWQALSLFFNGTRLLSSYSYVAMNLQSFRALKKNLPALEAMTERNASRKEFGQFIQKITGLIPHMELNEPKTLLYEIKGCLSLFEEHYLASKDNPEHLKALFEKAFDPSSVCLPAILRSLQSGMRELKREEAIAYTTYDEKTPLEQALGQEVGVCKDLQIKAGKLKPEDLPTIEMFKNYLQERNIYSVKATKLDGSVSTITPDEVNAACRSFVDLCLLED